MLFNSYIYLFFLPAVIIVYFTLIRYRFIPAAKSWLVFASLFFYAYWDPAYVPLIMSSILVNFTLGATITKIRNDKGRGPGLVTPKSVFMIGIVFNLGLLGYFKYADFFIGNINGLTGGNMELLNLTLPLAISFFTFQQVAYLADSYKGETSDYDFLNYCLFVSFFPQLIAGPIVHHREMMPQFGRTRNSILNWENMSVGLVLFSLGLFKKTVVADTFAIWATSGFDHAGNLFFLEAWAASLSYSFQIYYDFSGYTDMALGTAYFFNIKLPSNFNSPYKALNIQDFWRRWHMTLSRWFKDYLYIPLGGNRVGNLRNSFNVFLTFLLGGLWHGAGWTFIVWGLLHGAGSVVHLWWRKTGFKMPPIVGWSLTFTFINLTWVVFRASSFDDAVKVYRGMFGLNGIVLPEWLAGFVGQLDGHAFHFGNSLANIKGGADTAAALAAALIAVLWASNTNELKERFKPNVYWLGFVSLAAALSLICLTRVSEFIYFQF